MVYRHSLVRGQTAPDCLLTDFPVEIFVHSWKMPRPLRIEIENAFFHVMNRGVNRRQTFDSQKHFDLFCKLLSRAHEEMGLEIHSYCLMSNHYHLLVKTPRANLADCMKMISGEYTQKYNRLTKRDGPLFRGRYKSILIDEESYLARVSRYIHRNPVEAGICINPLTYTGSSLKYFQDGVKSPDWLVTSECTRHVSPRGRKSEYISFVKNEHLPSMHSFYESARIPSILGTEIFKYKLSRLSGPVDTSQALLKKSTLPNVSFEQVNLAVARIIPRQFSRDATIKRNIAAYLLKCSSTATTEAIRKAYGFQKTRTVSNALYRLRKTLRHDEELNNAVAKMSFELNLYKKEVGCGLTP
jgi:putative transposase